MSSEGSNNRKWKNLGSQMILAATGAVMVLSFQDCGAGFNASESSTNSASLSSSSSSSGSVVAPVGKVSSVSPAAQSANLGTSFSVPVVISSDSVYHGMVSVAVRMSDLSSVDTGAAINFAIDKPSFSLAVNSKQTINVTVNIPTMSPSFANQSVHIDVTDVASKSVLSSAILPLTVNAVYDVNIMAPISTTTENWTIAVGGTSSFIAHTEGLVVNFKNYDSRIHLVHSTGGPIPHESLSTDYPGTTALGMPASADGGTTMGGIYTNKVAAGAAAVSQVYDHFLESSSQIRTLKFNQPVPVAVSPTATPVANAATFTQVNTNILQSSCVGCHTGASGAGGVDLSTYAGVLKVVTAGDSSVSTLYLVVSGTSPSMPKGGTPLNATQLSEMQSWIDAGAKNN